MSTEPDLTQRNLSKQADELITAFVEVDKSVDDLGKRVDKHQMLIMRSIKRHRTVLKLVSAGMMIILIFAVVVATLFIQQRKNTERLDDLQRRTSLEILCPLYGVFINSIKTNPTPSNMTPQQAEFRANAAVVIQKGYEDLGCPKL